LNIVILGLSITSSWGNGHATTFRSLLRALAAQGHRTIFFERDQEWYASNRDLPNPTFCDLRIYQRWAQVKNELARELRDADVAVVGSYFPDGVAAIDFVLDSAVPIKAFYDIDTPITVAKLRERDEEYIRPDQVSGFDLYLSFTGGPLLEVLRTEFGAQLAAPLYCSVDPEKYRLLESGTRYACEFSYMGTYAADRQPKLQELFCKPAAQLSQSRFLLAGSQYPRDLRWPVNVRRITHLNPHRHAAFYSSSRLTLNLTREQMVRAGFSPSVRLFEAAACASPIVSDTWEGIETFFEPGQEILLADSAADVVRYLTEMNHSELLRIGRNAKERVLSEHTAAVRAGQFEAYVQGCKRKDVAGGISCDHARLKLQDA
jgi:spore maturation protein CgeB